MNTEDIQETNREILERQFPGYGIETPKELGEGLYRVRLTGFDFLYLYYENNTFKILALSNTADLKCILNSDNRPSTEFATALQILYDYHKNWAIIVHKNISERKLWYFTLASNQGGPGVVHVFAESWRAARDVMWKNYDNKWAFQYDSFEKVHKLDRKCINILVDWNI